MIRVILWKTLTEWWRDQRLKGLAIGVAALVVATALVGMQTTATMAQDRNAAVAKELANFLDQGDKNPHAAAHFGQYAFRPVLLPAAIDPGVSPWMGSMIWMEAHRRNLPEFRPAEDGAGYRPAGHLSVAWLLQYVVPLLIIILGFTAIAGERERGTLRLMLAQGTPLRSMVYAKAAALMLVLLTLLLPLVLLVMLGSGSTLESISVGQSWTRLAWLGTSYLLYLLGFVGIVLTVSLLARTALTALSVLLVAWMMLVILIPRLSIDLAAQQHSLPSATEFWEGIKRGEGLEAGASPIPAERAAALRAQVRDELLQRYGVTQVEALPVNFTAVYLQRLEERDAPIFDRAYGTLWQTQEQQRQARTLWGVLSPTVSLREISMAFAGTDPFAMMHFSEAAEQHRRRIVQMLNEKQAIEGAGKAFYVAPAETWQSIPSFIYAPPGWAEVWARHQRDFFVLLMWAVIPLMIAVTLAGRRREI